MAEDINKRIDQYVAIRDKLKQMDEQHDKARLPLVQIQEVLTGVIRQFMETNNITGNLKTDAGTCYLETRYTASLADPDIFMRHVIQTANYDLLDRRANVTAVKDYVKQNNGLPPGCNLNATQRLGVRRGSKKAE